MRKEIAGYPNYYIFETGAIISKRTGYPLCVDMSSGGYWRVTLCRDGVAKKFFIHRLIAQHFIEPIDGLNCVNHKDGDKLNNHVSNLEWISRSDNQKHAYKLGLQKPNRKYAIESVNKAFELMDSGVKRSAIMQETGLPQHLIKSIRSGRTWKRVE